MMAGSYSDIARHVEQWQAELDAPFHHKANALPYQTTVYDKPCCPGACKHGPQYKEGNDMLKRFLLNFGAVNILDLFMVSSGTQAAGR